MSLQGGDERALRALMERHSRWVRGVVYSVLGDLDLVEDVTQEVWLTVWQGASTLEDPGRLRPWLARLARNAAIDALRRLSSRRKYTDRFRRLVSRQRGESSHATPDRRLLAREEHEQVLEAIRRLPEIYRKVFVLRHLEEWSYRQIGEALEIPVDTVETRLVRARRMLRDVLTRPSRS